VNSIAKVQTSNYTSRSKYEQILRIAGFNELIKSFSDDHGPGQAGP
jgi:hypothetical protein